jgi:hypothetical protein
MTDDEYNKKYIKHQICGDGFIQYHPVKKRPPHDDDDIQEYVKPWVGLTDEEQHQLWRQWIESMDGWGSFYRAIEAKLKEKNT